MADVSVLSVITGGSSGIGAAAVELLAEGGQRVVVFDIHRPRAVVDGYFETDVGDPDSVKRSFDLLAQSHGSITNLVLAAGVDYQGSITDTRAEDWLRVVSVNAGGAFWSLQAAVPHMSPEGSSVVLVSSVNAALGYPNRSAYASSKGAVEAFTRVAAAELGPRGIRVNCVSPGAIDTPIWNSALQGDELARQEARSPLRRVGMASEVASVIEFLLSRRAAYINGAVIPVCGGRSTSDHL